MAYRISIDELGIAGDNSVFEADAPGDVWRMVADHLKQTRGIKLPDVDDVFDAKGGILPVRIDSSVITGQAGTTTAAGVVANRIEGDGEDDRGANLIATRLIEKLRMGTSGPGGVTLPPGGGPSLVP